MPIYSLEGTPGSGKTLYCVQKIIPEFLNVRDNMGRIVPRHIYTNIEGLKPELICAFMDIPYNVFAEYIHILGQRFDEQGNEYEDKDYVRWWMFEEDSIEWVEVMNGAKQREKVPNMEKVKRIPLGSLIILDELQNYYGNRDFAKQVSKECIEWITKNRHFGWTMWWMSQDIEAVDVTFRRNTQYVYFLESMENYGSPQKSSIKKYEGWLAGDKVNTPPYAKSSFKFDKRFFKTYKSYVDGVTGEKRYKTNILLSHKGFMTMIILIVLGVIYTAIHNPIEALTGNRKTQKTHATATATAPPIHHSFSGVSGGTVETRLDSVPCYVNHYKVNGVNYIVLPNGKTEKVKAGRKYEECQ